MNVFDSSALLAYLKREPGGATVESHLRAGGMVSAANWSTVSPFMAVGESAAERTGMFQEAAVASEGRQVGHPLSEGLQGGPHQVLARGAAPVQPLPDDQAGGERQPADASQWRTRLRLRGHAPAE